MMQHMMLLFATITLVLNGYSGNATLNVVSDNFSANYLVHNGSTISLAPGSYEFRLQALNKTFVKRVEVSGNGTVEFNLMFTNSTENLEVFYHTLIFASRGVEVSEVVLLNNTGDKNFEGDLAIPMPECEDIRVESSSLSYIAAEFDNGTLIFKDILIPAKGRGQITLSYRLKDAVFGRNASGAKFVVFTNLHVESYEGIAYEGSRSFGGTSFDVYSGQNSHYRLVLRVEGGFPFNPLAAAGIFLASAALYLYFRGKGGGWSL